MRGLCGLLIQFKRHISGRAILYNAKATTIRSGGLDADTTQTRVYGLAKWKMSEVEAYQTEERSTVHAHVAPPSRGDGVAKYDAFKTHPEDTSSIYL